MERLAEFMIIPLSRGKNATVDNADYPALAIHKWNAMYDKSTDCWYAKRHSPRIGGKSHAILMHRQILGLEYGDSRQGDHRNGDGLNNRRYNLRVATVFQNQQNSKKRSDNTTGYKGVSHDRTNQNYVAKIKVNGVRIHLGTRKTPEAAYELRLDGERRYHGEFARRA